MELRHHDWCVLRHPYLPVRVHGLLVLTASGMLTVLTNLSTKEIWGKNGSTVIDADSAEEETKQLDYYIQIMPVEE